MGSYSQRGGTHVEVRLPPNLWVQNRKSLAITTILIVGILVAPLAAGAQKPGKIPRIGVLGAGSPTSSPHLFEAFRQGLRELGHVEGQSIVFEYRWARGKLEELRKLASELVQLKVDVIFAANTPTALAAKEVTNAIPIVFATVADPLGMKLIAGLAQPGGNITGLTTINVELVPKRLELLKEVSRRKISRVGLLFNPTDPSNVLALRELEGPARVLGMELRPLEVRSPEDFEGAFSAMTSERIDALMVAAGTLTVNNAKRIADLAATIRIPAMYGTREFVDAGGLMSYSASFRDNFRRAATYVDKILKGAKPAELPVEQPTRFELVVNLKTAKTLGLTIPQTILIRADHVIQ
ncbi:MAG TPA: ABC transporter substrate-binding protein [Methylomirabilota bacterium]|nr:ABC transporter substrate-binding protein [Methylomirabilota bacterium]